MKKTQDVYQQKEAQFKEDSQKRLDERLKTYDQRIQEITLSQKKSTANGKSDDKEEDQGQKDNQEDKTNDEK